MRGRNRQTSQQFQALTLRRWTAHHHAGQPVVLAQLGQGSAIDRGLQHLRYALGAHAKRAGTILIDVDVDAFGGLRSIQVNTDRIGIRAHRFGDAVGMDSGDGTLRTRYPVLQHIAHRRTIFEPVHPPAHVGKLRGKDFEQVRADAFARRQIMGVEHELSKTCRRQLLIERQKIARRTSAYVGHLAIEPRDARKQCLQPTRHRIGLGDGSTFLQFEIHHQFEPVRGRKKLIRHRREQRQAAQEQRGRHGDGQPAMIDAQGDQAAKMCVERRLINRVHVRAPITSGCVAAGMRARFGPQFFLRQ